MFISEKNIRRVFLVFGILLFVYVIQIIRTDEIIFALKLVGFNILILLTFLFIEVFLKTLRFKILLNSIKELPTLKLFQIIFETTFFTVYSPGRVGEVIKLDLLKRRYKLKRIDSLGTLMIERISDLFVILLFSIGTLIAFIPVFHPIFYLTLLLVLLCFIILYKYKKSRKLLERIFHTVKITARNKKTMFVTFVSTPIIWAVEALIPYYVLILLGHAIPFSTVLFLYFSSSLIGLLSMIPGGLGSVELSFSYLLSNLTNISRQDAVMAIMVTRMVTLIFALFGLILYFKNLKNVGQFKND